MNFRNLLLPLAAAATMSLTACETGSGSAVSWQIATDANSIGIMATLNQSYAINGEATMFFKNYGSVRIGQNNIGQSTITFAMAQNAFGDIGLGRYSTLPTGGAFPSLITGPMLGASILNDSSMSANIYFSNQRDADGTVRRLIGLSVGFRGISTSFGTLSLTENYFNAQGLKFASFTIYGGSNTAPGGLFLAADVNHFSTAASLKASTEAMGGHTELEVRGRGAAKYKTQADRQQLGLRMLADLERAGAIRRR